MVLLIGAWTWRDDRVLGRPVLVSTNGGYNLWLGNCPGANASTGNRFDAPGMEEEHNRIWSGSTGEMDRDRAFARRAREYIRNDPGRFLCLSLSKAAGFWALYPQPMTQDRPRFQGEKLISIFSYGLLLPFALVWLFLRLRQDRASPMILLLLLVHTAIHAVILAKVRLRLPLDVFVILCGTGGMLAAWGGAAIRPACLRRSCR